MQTHVSSNLEFVERDDSIPTELGLYVSDATQREAIRGKVWSGSTYEVIMGAALESNAERSLETIFRQVQVADNPTDLSSRNEEVPFILELGLGNGTVNPGAFTFSNQRVTLGLEFKVYDAKGRIVLKGTSRKTGEHPAGAKGYFGGQYYYIRAIRIAAEEALYLSLEELNDFLLENRHTFEKPTSGTTE